MTTPLASRPFTGRGRRKQTSWTVRVADVVAKWCITVGGIGTILAVSTVFLFLFSVVTPLFRPAQVEHAVTRQLPDKSQGRLAVGLDEFRTTAWWVDRTGSLEVLRIDTGDVLTKRALLDGMTPTSVSTTLGSPDVVIGASNGTLCVGTIAFSGRFLDSTKLPTELIKQLDAGQNATFEGGVVQRTSQGQLRQQVLETKWNEPLKITDGPIRLLDHSVIGGGDGLGSRQLLVAFATENGQTKLCKLAEQQNPLTGETTYEVNSFELPTQQNPPHNLVKILIAGRGDNVFLIWENGLLRRFDIRDTTKIALVEEVHLLRDPTAHVTASSFVLGRETLVCGDSHGGLRAWFRVRHSDDTVGDGQRLTMVHDLTTGSGGVSSIHPSERGRTVIAGYDDGSVRLIHVTTERRMLFQQLAEGSPVLNVAIAPKEDGLFALTKDRMWSAAFDPRHPEATISALFRPVWYEGYDRPSHIWQSSSATSSPEMKLGVLPLIHGTLKATLYAMLFATPLAILAAIYTSEFLHPRMRSVVKPTIEMMASLPSVVLGFLAALVFAVVVETCVPQILCTVFCLPFVFLCTAYLWQLLPTSWTVRLQPWRIAFLPVPMVLGGLLGFRLGPLVEQWLFAGNVMRWLDGQIGNGIGAWLLLWVPLCALGTTALVISLVNPMLRRLAQHRSREQFVLINLAKFLAATAFVVVAAYGISWLLNAAGWDPRGSYVSTYVQRNAFVVGMVMGFAVIPIIFTIADDALSTVPQHLRSASLACGATPWQTAFRVVVPTAMSGLFSAVMIGLGRAVGETMIVLMAGGNTAVMDWNLFNGFRTLAANIAVELPEAVRHSTHYRVLFLSALTLFMMTFVLNTLAEMVRIRFRKRAFQL